MKPDSAASLAEFLRETGRAHHEAFAETDGADPDWAIWYADYLCDGLRSRFGIDITRSYLVHCLIRADIEHQARAPDTDWATFYAREFLEHLSPEHEAADKLSLYYMPTCPFCIMVQNTIQDLGIDVEYRNTLENVDIRNDLIAARGRATVPVLRITSTDGEDRWMPESRDIIHYLRSTFG